MRTAHINEDEFKKDILRIFSKHLSLEDYKIFFFGSRVVGKGSERSDIDIGIKGKQPVPNVVVRRIKQEIEDLNTLYSIDIVDFSKTSEDFEKVALSQSEPIYS